jgi:hypothetical protein
MRDECRVTKKPEERSMVNDASTLKAVDLLIEAANVDKV